MNYKVSTSDQNTVSLNEEDYIASTLQDIAVLLSTRQGSIPMYRKFGLPQRFLDMPTNTGIPVMIAEVTEAMREYLPNVELVEVIPSYDKDNPGRLVPTVEVKMQGE